MELCASGHEPIVFEGTACPLCAEISAKIRVEEELSDAEDELVSLRAKVESMKE